MTEHGNGDSLVKKYNAQKMYLRNKFGLIFSAINTLLLSLVQSYYCMQPICNKKCYICNQNDRYLGLN